MTYLAGLLYPFVYKAKRGKFVGDFNMGRGKFIGDLICEGVSLLEILIWVQYKGMWIKNLPYMSY
jgi:hypothetical protein